MKVVEQFKAQMNALYNINNMLCSSFDLDKVLDQVLERAVELFQAEAGSIMLLEDGTLRISKALKLTDDVIANTSIKLGQGIVGRVVENSEAMLLNGKADSTLFNDLVEREDTISSSMCAPLIRNNKTIGVVNLRRSNNVDFTNDDLEFFKAMAAQAAVAIEIANLYKAERERAEQLRLEKVHMQSIFAHMADAVVVFSADYEIVFANELAKRAFSDQGPMIGEDLRMFFPAVPWTHVREQVIANGGFDEFEVQPIMSREDSFWRGTITHWSESGDDSYVLVLHDVTERVRVERMKAEFMSSVSHELKTPLTSIIGFVELLMERELNRDRQMRCLTICHDESRRLLHLIEEILMVSKLENGSFRLSKSRNIIDKLLTQAVSNYAERYPSYTFSLSVDTHDVALDFDEVLINQVIENLLSNAVKYTLNDGHITVRLKTEENNVVISVADNGIGISRDNIPFIFEKFYRVDNSTTRHTGGVGLGLSNARHILDEHGGSIWVESKEGQGSTFSFSLPITHNNNEQKG